VKLGPGRRTPRHLLLALVGLVMLWAVAGVVVKGGAVTNSVVMRSATRTVRFIEAHHRFDRQPEY